MLSDHCVYTLALETNFFKQYAPSSTCSCSSNSTCLFCRSSHTFPKHMGKYIWVLTWTTDLGSESPESLQLWPLVDSVPPVLQFSLTILWADGLTFHSCDNHVFHMPQTGVLWRERFLVRAFIRNSWSGINRYRYLANNTTNISNDNWVKRDQLDATCFIITLFSAQRVLDVNTSILRSLRLIRWVTSWVVSGSMCVGVTLQCGYGGMQAEACIRIPHHHSHTAT